MLNILFKKEKKKKKELGTYKSIDFLVVLLKEAITICLHYLLCQLISGKFTFTDFLNYILALN